MLLWELWYFLQWLHFHIAAIAGCCWQWHSTFANQTSRIRHETCFIVFNLALDLWLVTCVDFWRVCHSVAAPKSSPLHPMFPCRPWTYAHTLTRVVKKRYKYRATGYIPCSKHVEAVHLTICHSTLISGFRKTTRAMQASYSQGLTCIKSHNTNPYNSQKHPKTTKKQCSSFTNMHDWPALIWQRPRKVTPSWTENRECPRLKVMLIANKYESWHLKTTIHLHVTYRFK